MIRSIKTGLFIIAAIGAAVLCLVIGLAIGMWLPGLRSLMIGVMIWGVFCLALVRRVHTARRARERYVERLARVVGGGM